MKFEAASTILQVLQNLPDDYSKFNALLKKHYYDQALQTAQNLKNNYSKVDTLIKIAITRADQGQREQALDLWQLTSYVAQAIANIDEREKASVLVIQSVNHVISADLGLINQSDQASDVYTQAIKIAQRLEKSEYKNIAIYDLSRQIANDQKMEQAIQLINENNVIVPSDSYMADPANSEFYKWAKQSGSSEAYCFTNSPSFDDCTVLYVWADETQPTCWYVLAKQRREKQRKLSRKDYSKLLVAIEESYFWHSVTWSLSQGLGGTTWQFGGWREGKYKCLRAWNPTNGAPYKLGLAFAKLLPQGFRAIANSGG